MISAQEDNEQTPTQRVGFLRYSQELVTFCTECYRVSLPAQTRVRNRLPIFTVAYWRGSSHYGDEFAEESNLVPY